MFDSLGKTLVRSSRVLASDIRPSIEDEFLVEQLDAVSLIVGEVGACWPHLFAAINRENAILESTLERVGAELPTLKGNAGSVDPFQRNHALLRQLDNTVARLHDQGETELLRSVRSGLKAVAEAEDEMFAKARESVQSLNTRRL